MKLVKEAINFKREEDPHNALGVGNYIKIKNWLEEYNVSNYIINDDLTIDVMGLVRIEHYNDLFEFPDYIQFNIIENYFSIYDNKFKSLRGCPRVVGGHFACSNNLLTSLEYGPSRVTKDYYCSNNRLSTLKGAPGLIYGDFECHKNKLSTLDYIPKIIKGNLICGQNLGLFSEKYINSLCKVRGSIDNRQKT